MALAEPDDTADVCTDSKGNPEPDTDRRDYENVPLKEDMDECMKREVLPHVPDAWVDESKTRIGYEINSHRCFYKYEPPRQSPHRTCWLSWLDESCSTSVRRI